MKLIIMSKMKFSAQLRNARKKAGLTIAEASAFVGTSPRTWAYWEAGEKTPPTQTEVITRERVLRMIREAAR